jgi:hypothetical protein
MPHIIVLAEMEEGFRLTGGMGGIEPERVAIGLPVATDFVMSGDVATFQFRPA